MQYNRVVEYRRSNPQYQLSILSYTSGFRSHSQLVSLLFQNDFFAAACIYPVLLTNALKEQNNIAVQASDFCIAKVSGFSSSNIKYEFMYHCALAYPMSKFVRDNFALKILTDNTYKAIDEGAYDAEKYNFYMHDSISLKQRILSCPHAPLVTEIKFSSPSRGEIADKGKFNLTELASAMVRAGSTSLSIVTQPRLFNGSIDHLAKIRKSVNVPLLMKDVIVSETQIDAAKRIGSDCILLIKSIFDHDLAEASMERFAEHARKKGLQIIVETHSEKEFQEVLRFNKDNMNNLIGINNRDLNNLNVDIRTTERLLKQHSKGKNIVISESGINTAKEIQFLKKAGADAFLVGTSIMESTDISSKVSELYLSV